MTIDRAHFLRFGVSGFVVAVTYVALFALLIRAGMAAIIANTLSFCTAIVVQYLLQTKWTFRQEPDAKQGAKFLTVIGFGLLYSTIIVTWIGPALLWQDWFSASFTAVTLPIFNYISFRLWVYRPKALGDST